MPEYIFTPLDVAKLSNVEISNELRDVAEYFPISGSNYRIQILQEAIKRMQAEDEAESA